MQLFAIILKQGFTAYIYLLSKINTDSPYLLSLEKICSVINLTLDLPQPLMIIFKPK